jgi:hypothetical protein
MPETASSVREMVDRAAKSPEYAWVFTVNEGKVTCQQEYLRHAEALAAVGLSE